MDFVGASTAAIINLGTVSALDGDIYLIAREIQNAGTISAPNGEANLLVGGEIILAAEGTAGVRVGTEMIDMSDVTAIENSGTVEAAKARLEAAGGNLLCACD